MQAKQVAILETRMGEQLAGLVAGRGGVPFHAPALAELPDLDPQAIAQMVMSLQKRPAKLVIFQTGVGTKALFAVTDSLSLTAEFLAALKDSLVAARGPKPSGVLRSRGVRIDYSAADPFTTHEMLDELGGLKLDGERVIVQRYGSLNRDLDAALAARGAEVTEIPTYRWSLPPDTAPLEQLVARLERGEMHAVVFTNAEQARNLFAVSARLNKEEALKKALNRVLVASIGPVASAALREAGIKVGLEASPPKMGALLTALDKALS
jgi:uroporphyrinogen-III synthase